MSINDRNRIQKTVWTSRRFFCSHLFQLVYMRDLYNVKKKVEGTSYLMIKILFGILWILEPLINETSFKARQGAAA